MIPIVSISFEWKEQDPDGRNCSVCNEPIYSKMYVQTVLEKETNVKLCEPCYNLMQNEKDYQKHQ